MTQVGLLIGIDPGVSTGFAMKFPDGVCATATYLEPPSLWNILKDNKPQAVALETFARSERIDANMIKTMELVGSIKGICHVLNIKCYPQEPQVRKSFIPDAIAILEAQGRKVSMAKDKDSHEVDALSHLLCLEYRIKEGKIKL